MIVIIGCCSSRTNRQIDQVKIGVYLGFNDLTVYHISGLNAVLQNLFPTRTWNYIHLNHAKGLIIVCHLAFYQQSAVFLPVICNGHLTLPFSSWIESLTWMTWRRYIHGKIKKRHLENLDLKTVCSFFVAFASSCSPKTGSLFCILRKCEVESHTLHERQGALWWKP